MADIGDPSYICSPQSTIIAAVIVVLLLNFSLVAGFVFFYRLKRKHWTKTKEGEELRQLPAATLARLLASDELTCREEEVWRALESWEGAKEDRLEVSRHPQHPSTCRRLWVW